MDGAIIEGVRTLVALVAIVAGAGYAAAPTATEVPPFQYRYEVTSVTLHATFTNGTATAITELELAARPKARTLSWYGRKSAAAGNGASALAVRLAGTATYRGMQDPACNGTVTLDGSRWRPIWATVALDRRFGPRNAKLSVSAGRFPVATTYSRRACENGALTWWQPGLVADQPFAVVRKRGFSVTGSEKHAIEDGSSLEWTVTMSVRRVRYGLVNCTRTVWC